MNAPHRDLMHPVMDGRETSGLRASAASRPPSDALDPADARDQRA